MENWKEMERKKIRKKEKEEDYKDIRQDTKKMKWEKNKVEK
jgi:hypothetical protein